MKSETWIFLRSAHRGEAERTCPPPAPDLERNQDLWTHLFARIIRSTPEALGIIVRMGKPYEVRYDDSLIDVRVPDFRELANLRPAVVINRAGYREYLPIERARGFINAFRLYIGCGERYNPAAWKYMAGLRFDMFLCDSPAQRDELSGDWPGATVTVLQKPALDAIFRPANVPRQFDICFNCHRPVEFKGCAWLARRIPAGARVLRIGPEDPWFAAERDSGRLVVTFTGQIERRHVPDWACRATMGVVCDDGTKDSGPRVLPEFLAMDIPVLVRSTVRADLDAYVRPETGLVVDGGMFEFQEAFELLRCNRNLFHPRRHYTEHLSLDVVGPRLAAQIKEARDAAPRR